MDAGARGRGDAERSRRTGRALPVVHAYGEEPTACGSIRGGLTDREVDLLFEMRQLKAEPREAPAGERPALAARLESLKALREQARAERMALLGYDP